MKKISKVLMILCICVFSPIVTFSATIRVPTDQPTIQAGINAAGTGDTVLIAPGTYTGTGNRNLSTAGKTVLVMGQYGADSTIIDCESVYNGFSSISSTTKIRGLTIRNGVTGIYCGTASPTIDSSKFVSNSSYGVYLEPNGFPNLFDNSYSNNGHGIGVAGGTMSKSGTWHNDGDEPYEVLGDVIVAGSPANTLTIEPGVTVKFDSAAGLQIGYYDFLYGTSYPGQLNSIGKADSLITFTSFSGLTNGWDGIYFEPRSGQSGAVSTMRYCVVEKAGQNGFGTSANIYCNTTNQPTMSHCTIREATGIGVNLTNSSITIDSSSFVNNTSYSIQMQVNDFPNLFDNSYSGNAHGKAVTGGFMDVSGTWHNDGDAPYEILGDVIVSALPTKNTLTIEPGVTVKFDSAAGLQIGYYDFLYGRSYPGQLNSMGKADSLITFTSLSGLTNGWDGIYFADQSDMNGAVSTLSYCVVEKAGQTGFGTKANIYCNETNQPTISHSIIRQTMGSGLFLFNSSISISSSEISSDSIGIYCNGSSPSVHNGTIKDNLSYPIYLTSQSLPNLSGNIYSGNTKEEIVVTGGTFSVNGTWHNDGDEPYKVLGDVTVAGLPANTLTIEPGVTVKFDSAAGLQIGYYDFLYGTSYPGQLNSIGKADSLITFTSFSGLTNGWDGIYFEPRSGQSGAVSTMRYCVVEKAGQGGFGANANIYCVNTNQPGINNCIIREASGIGVHLNSASIAIDSSSFVNNSSYSIKMEVNDFPDLFYNTYSGNGRGKGIAAGTIGRSGIWHYDSAEPYEVLGDIVVGRDGLPDTLTIEPGVTVKFDSAAGLQIGYRDWLLGHDCPGQLSSAGTSEKLITFTSLSGMSRGWDGIYFADQSDHRYNGIVSTLRYCVVEKAGQGGFGANANIYCVNTNQPGINNCIIREATGSGIYLSGSTIIIDTSIVDSNKAHGVFCSNSSPSIRNTQILDNDSIGIFCEERSQPTIGDSATLSCQLYGNGAYDIYNNTANTIYARHNFWGLYDSNAIAQRIYDHDDNPAKGSVFFMPFDLLEHDVMADRILAPDTVVFYQTVLTPEALIHNTGEMNDTIPVIFKIGSFYRDSNSIVLAPGDSGTVSFKDWIADSIGTFLTHCITALPADGFRGNDTALSVVAIIIDSMAPIITSVTPNFGGNIGARVLKISGHNFQGRPTIKLTRPGESDLVVDSSLVLDYDSTAISVVLDVRGLAVGPWNIVVANPNSSQAIFYEGFSVVLGYDNMWVNILGRNQVLNGRAELYNLRYGNSGNIDEPSPWLLLEIPRELVVRFPTSDSMDFVYDPADLGPEYDTVENVVLSIPLLDLMAGSDSSVDMYVTSPGNWPPHTFFSIQATIVPAWVPEDKDRTSKSSLLLQKIDSRIKEKIKVEFYVWCNKEGCFEHPVFYLPDINGNPIAYTQADEKYNGEWRDYLLRVPEAEVRGKFPDSAKRYPQNGPKEVELDANEFERFRDQLDMHCCGSFHWTHDDTKWKAFPDRGNCVGIFEWLAELAFINNGRGFMGFFEEHPFFTTPMEEMGFGFDIHWTNPNLAGMNLQRNLSEIDYRWCRWWWNKLIEHLTSRDPNDKTGPTGIGFANYLSLQEPFEYMIYFENVDSATASAESIWVADTLSENLDWSTFKSGQIHPGDGPDSIRPNFNIVTNFDSLNGVVSWGLFNINLPPDTAPYWGEGWVSYSVRPKTNLLSGTQIKNRACIKFDVNPWLYAPMDSSYIINTIDAAPPTSRINPLPDTASGHYFQVCWSGHDDSLGSGIRDYTICVSDNGGPYEIWLSNTTQTCSTYIGNTGRTYCFYSIARDNVGHVEIVPDTLCTTTRNYKVGDSNGDNKVNISDVVYLVNYLFKGGPQPVPGLAAGNVNCDTKVTVADIVYLVNYLFRGGPPPCVGTEYSVALNKSTQQGYVKSSFVKFDDKGDGVVSLSSGTKAKVAGMQFELEYSPTDIDGIEVYPTERTQRMGLYYLAKDGKLTIGLVDIYGENFIPSGEGPLFNLKVKPKTEKADLSSLKIKQAILVDSSAKELEVTIINDIKFALIPKIFSLSQNYPNPFNPNTVIEYALPMSCPVRISIYNILGQRVRMLIDENQTAGYKKVVWDSKNDEGQEVASGIYFYKIQAGDFSKAKKMVILK